VEKVDFRIRPPRGVDRFAAGDDPVSLLVREIKALTQDQGKLSSFASDALNELKLKLPVELNQDEGPRLDATDAPKELLNEAEGELLARLEVNGGAQ
jgi:hypothetical protein